MNALDFISAVDELEKNNTANKKMLDNLNKSIDKHLYSLDVSRENLDVVLNAISILRGIQDDSVRLSYKEIEDSVNNVLSRVFPDKVRKIELVESTRGGKYPQLDLKLRVAGGKERSLKNGSGHGIMQIVSLICNLSLIIITGSRKLLVLDEVLSGLSASAKEIISEILNQFTELGFQFVVSEHFFVPSNANVYRLEVNNDISDIADNYINNGDAKFISNNSKD
jgi:hypothetical protein